jgi:hypothetical protein
VKGSKSWAVSEIPPALLTVVNEAVWHTSWPAGFYLFFSKKNMAINIYIIHRPSVFGAGPLRYLDPSVSFIYKATFEAFNP